MKINLVLRHTFDLDSGVGGWIRFGRVGRFYGPGLAWIPSCEPLSFSERNGYKRYFVSRGFRWTLVAPRLSRA